jgi:hypothetical protein
MNVVNNTDGNQRRQLTLAIGDHDVFVSRACTKFFFFIITFQNIVNQTRTIPARNDSITGDVWVNEIYIFNAKTNNSTTIKSVIL